MTSPADQNTAMPAAPQKVIKDLFATKAKKPAEGQVLIDAAQKNRQKTWIYCGLSAILLVVYGVLFFYPNLTRMFHAGEQIQETEHSVADYKDNLLPKLEKERAEAKEKYESELNKGENIVNQIFPATVDKIGITERLESFASLINSKTPPFEMDSISFGKPIEGKEYDILPISTSFSTSRANLDRFLKLIDLSGRFDSEYHVRLIEIEQIDLRYLGTDSKTGSDKGVSVSVKLKAYSRP